MYVKVSDNKHKIIQDKVSANVIREAFDMMLERYSQGDITKKFNKKKYLTGSERKKVLRGQSLED
ncbi:MAG: recombinase family protein [Peptoniphilaceae bacterium]